MNVEKIIESIPAMSQQERDRVRANAENLIEKGSTVQKAAAAKVVAELDEVAEAEHQQLVDRLSGMEVSTRVVEAFTTQPMTETEEKIVRALIENPNSSSTELSRKCGWGGQSWHMHFGTMCFNRAIYLWPAPKSEARETDFYSGILADWSEDNQWTIKPEVEAAFAELGVTAKT
ncbi:MAG: hypothetical protein CL820_10745 [Croceicoccus sp.]|nr:hypothetical protein [Croceicoccus sp.]MAL26353.1 hypothetical protein [Croceicoccus sp.]